MTQPEAAPAGGGPLALLTRRVGPAPVWLWFLVFVIAVVIYLRYRAKKNTASAGTATAGQSSNAYQSPALTTQATMGTPYTTDTFVNIQQPGDTGPAGPAGPSGPAGPQGVPGNATATAAPATPASIVVAAGQALYGLPGSVADTYNLTGGQLAALNPNLWATNNIWRTNAQGNKYPVAKSSATYRLM